MNKHTARTHARSTAVTILAALGAVSVACGGIDQEQAPPADDTAGAVTFTLTIVPPDVQCIRVTAKSDRTIKRLFDVTPGRSATYTLNGLPVGFVQITQEGFNFDCDNVESDSVPTWASPAPIEAVVVAKQTVTAEASLRPTGNLRLTTDFDESAFIVEPATGNFGAGAVGSNVRELTFTVRNVGKGMTGTLRPSIVGQNAADFAVTAATCTAINVNQTCTVTVAFRPLASGARRASLVVSGMPGGLAAATLIGEGLTPATIVVSPPHYDFGSATPGMRAPLATLTATNIGQVHTGRMRITLTQPGDRVVFLFAPGGTCPDAGLAPGASCTILVSATAANLPPGTVDTTTIRFTSDSGAVGTATVSITVR